MAQSLQQALLLPLRCRMQQGLDLPAHVRVELLMALCHSMLHPRVHASVLLQLLPQVPANVVFQSVAEIVQHCSCVASGLAMQVLSLAQVHVRVPLRQLLLVDPFQLVPAQMETMSGYVNTFA